MQVMSAHFIGSSPQPFADHVSNFRPGVVAISVAIVMARAAVIIVDNLRYGTKGEFKRLGNRISGCRVQRSTHFLAGGKAAHPAFPKHNDWLHQMDLVSIADYLNPRSVRHVDRGVR